MLLKVFSLFDHETRNSILVTCHPTEIEAQREFNSNVQNDVFKGLNDLSLYHIGMFETSVPELLTIPSPIEICSYTAEGYVRKVDEDEE